MSVSFLTVIYIVGLIQTVYVLKSLQTSNLCEKKKRADLTIFLVLFSLSLVDGLAFMEEIYIQFPHLLGVIWSAYMLYGPFLYFFIIKNSYPEEEFRYSKNRRHFIPFLLSIIVYAPLYFLYSAEEKIVMLQVDGYDEYITLLEEITPLTDAGVIAFYFVLIFLRLKKHHKIIKENFSEIEKYSFDWLVKMVFSLWLVLMSYILDIILDFGLIHEIAIVIWLLVFNWKLLHFAKKEHTLKKVEVGSGEKKECQIVN